MTLNAIDKKELRRRELWEAVRNRALTSDELREVAQYGQNLNVKPNENYDPDDKGRELTVALQIQQIWQFMDKPRYLK